MNMRTADGAAADTLSRCRELVWPALRAAVATLDPRLEAMSGFTLGWRDVGGAAVPDGGGKGLRPALAVLGARAAGAPAETGVPGAVAVELVHAFSLVHDDIMDGDERRRHRPTAWKAYGVGPALLTGDALLALALETLASSPGDERAEASRLLCGALMELVGGQAADVSFESRPWTGPGAVTVEEYRDMAARKTGALLGCSAAIGAVLAGAPAPVARGLAEAGRRLGLAFQMVDDVLGIWGDPDVTGKPVYSDLRRRKKTLPVLAALAGPAPDARLVELLDRARDEDDLRRTAELIAAAGGRDHAEDLARRNLDAALAALAGLDLDGTATAELVALAEFLADRRS
ncbi:polyprenyl synthetase family protein [Actinomadura sp. 21ATH]|uniref:polyprenyl synthetase family protein n=1 Tax=Actinomadura sp. 21ATH TaxID=1735444 RepID=UPI0035C1F9C6